MLVGAGRHPSLVLIHAVPYLFPALARLHKPQPNMSMLFILYRTSQGELTDQIYSPQSLPRPPSPGPRAVLTAACEADDVAIVRDTLRQARKEGAPWNISQCMDSALQRAITLRAMHVLDFLLRSGGNVTCVSLDVLTPAPPIAMLDLLHSYDLVLGAHSLCPLDNDSSFLDKTLHDDAVARWALEHGALDKRRRSAYQCTLERAVSVASLGTVKLMREHGASVGHAALHRAVEAAAERVPPDGVSPAANQLFPERFAVVRYLVEELEVDVNFMVPHAEVWTQMPQSPPLHGVARRVSGDYSKTIVYLLDHGADPDIVGRGESSLQVAQRLGNTAFLETVHKWRQGQSN